MVSRFHRHLHLPTWYVYVASSVYFSIRQSSSQAWLAGWLSALSCAVILMTATTERANGDVWAGLEFAEGQSGGFGTDFSTHANILIQQYSARFYMLTSSHGLCAQAKSYSHFCILWNEHRHGKQCHWIIIIAKQEKTDLRAPVGFIWNH